MLTTRSFLTALVPAALLAASPVLAAEATSTFTDAQRDEVRALVKEVMADSGQRGTFASGMTAGIDDKGSVFLKSEDGTFKLGVKGRVQFRYIYNHQNDRPAASGDESVDGFQLRRTKLTFAGQVGNPKVKYEIVLAAERSPGAGPVGVEEANLAYDATDEMEIKVGKMKLPFLREELVSSGKQVAVERSSVCETYTLNRALAAQVGFDMGQANLKVALHNGGNTESTSFNATPADYAIASRLEWQPIGTAKDMGDNFALKHADQQALMFGIAGDHEKVNTPAAGFATGFDTVTAYTADMTLKAGGMAFNLAGMGSHANGVGATSDVTNWGVAALADFRVSDQVDLFARWEMFDDHNGGPTVSNDQDRFQAVTVGANYFLNSKVKLTGDVVWFYDGHNTSAAKLPLNSGALSDGAGLTSFSGSQDQQVAVRLQVQCEF